MCSPERSGHWSGESASVLSPLLNCILGGVILWMGQATVQHHTTIATLESRVDDLNERSRSQSEHLNQVASQAFPREEGLRQTQMILQLDRSTHQLRDAVVQQMSQVNGHFRSSSPHQRVAVASSRASFMTVPHAERPASPRPLIVR